MGYYFKLPDYTELTEDQQAAVSETDALALSGGPGTGKTVVCLWRHVRNHSTGSRNSLLLTYTKTLEHYLSQCARMKNASAGTQVNRTLKWSSSGSQNHYDEIIIDEGQDVGIDRYKKIMSFASSVSYGADDAQQLYDEGCSVEELEDLFPENEEYSLTMNFRSSSEILEFARSVFPDLSIRQDAIDNSKESGNKPIVNVVGWGDEEETQAIMSVVNDYGGDSHNIGVLVPGRNQVKKYYEMIQENIEGGQTCSRYEGDMEGFKGLEGVHVTTFKSSKGLEFDTVIIPSFDSMDWYMTNTDRISDKDYFVAITRAKLNLFLICKKFPNQGDSDTFDVE